MAHIKLVDVSIRDGNQSIWGATGLNAAAEIGIDVHAAVGPLAKRPKVSQIVVAKPDFRLELRSRAG